MCIEVLAPKDVYLHPINALLHLPSSTNDMPKHVALAMSKNFSSSPVCMKHRQDYCSTNFQISNSVTNPGTQLCKGRS